MAKLYGKEGNNQLINFFDQEKRKILLNTKFEEEYYKVYPKEFLEKYKN